MKTSKCWDDYPAIQDPIAKEKAITLFSYTVMKPDPPAEPDYKALVDLAARVLLQHLNDEDYEMSLAGLYAALTEHKL